MSTGIEIQDGAVLRDGEKVGTIDAEGIFAPVDGLHHKTAESIRKWLAENPAPRTEGPSTPPPGIFPPAPPVEPTPPAVAAPEIPPAPEKDPRWGDKTPEYVEWLRTYHPEQAEKQYANRKVSAE